MKRLLALCAMAAFAFPAAAQEKPDAAPEPPGETAAPEPALGPEGNPPPETAPAEEFIQTDAVMPAGTPAAPTVSASPEVPQPAVTEVTPPETAPVPAAEAEAPPAKAAPAKPKAAAAPAAEEAPDPAEADAMRLLKAAQAAKLRGTVLLGTMDSSYTIVVGVEGVPIDKGQGVWRWASVTKQVMAVLAMQEVEAGRLSLDLPIAPYLGDLKVPNADQITVRQLLRHQSGLANPEDGPKDATGRTRRYLTSELSPPPGPLPECFGPPKRAPGGEFEYNNCDYQILGYIIERTAAQSLPVLIRDRITGPLGMVAARLLKPGERLGQPVGPQKAWVDDKVDESRYGAAGAMVGQVRDLWLFDRGLMAGRLLKPESLAELWKGDPALGYVALGAWAYSVPIKGCAAPVRLIERRGAIGNTHVRNVIAPELGRVVIAFSLEDLDFGEPWQGRGVTHDLLSAALCPPA